MCGQVLEVRAALLLASMHAVHALCGLFHSTCGLLQTLCGLSLAKEGNEDMEAKAAEVARKGEVAEKMMKVMDRFLEKIIRQMVVKS